MLKTRPDCPKFENCSATLCPLADNLKHLIWYPDEDICKAKKFQTLPWLKKQKAIARSNAPNDRYFTIEMLEAITRVQKGIAGIDPDQPLKEAERAERDWILAFQKRAKLQSYEPRKDQNSKAKKREVTSFMRNMPCQAKGGEK